MLPIVEDEPAPRRAPRRWPMFVLPLLAGVALLVGVLQAKGPSPDPVAGPPLPELDERTGVRLLALADDGFVLIDPDRGISVPVDLPPLVDAGGPWVVAADREELRCELEVVDMRPDGRRRTVAIAPYRACLQGRSAVSPDGRRLALPVAEYLHGSGARRGRLVVVEPASGEVTRVPRTDRPVPIFSSLTWAPSGRWLFWADPVGNQPIGAYRVGGAGALAVRPAGLSPGGVRGVWAIAG